MNKLAVRNLSGPLEVFDLMKTIGSVFGLKDNGVRSPTRTEVRSPTRTSTSTKAHTSGNVTVTGGAGAHANTSVVINPGKRRLKDSIAYDTDILNFGTGCWKFNCADTKGLYFPMVMERRNFDLGSFHVEAVKETNLVPYLAAGLFLFFIMR